MGLIVSPLVNNPMKGGLLKCCLFILFTFIAVCFPVFTSTCYADDPPSCPVTFDDVQLNTLSGNLFTVFPFSLLPYCANLLDGMASITPLSPAGMEVSLYGDILTFHPFEWFEGSYGVDVVFSAIRVVMLTLLIFGLVKHVLEYIL